MDDEIASNIFQDFAKFLQYACNSFISKIRGIKIPIQMNNFQ